MRHRMEEALVGGVSNGLRMLPMATVRAYGARFGRAVSRLDRFHRRVALDNLQRAFPSRGERELRRIVGATFGHFGSVLLELIRFGTLAEHEMLDLVDVEGKEHVRQAYAQGHGVIFLTGHFGYWEVAGITFPLVFDQELSVLARPLDNPYLHEMLERIRTRTGNHVIYRQGALRRVLRELAANRGVAFLIDQHMHNDTVVVDFFNRPAATSSALAAVALRTQAPVIPCFGLPSAGGRYRIVYERPVPPPDDGADAIRVFTQRCTDVLEMYVRKDPQLWLWMHRRWRAQPPEVAAADETP